MNKFFFPLKEGYYYGRHLNKELKSILGNKLVQDSHATGLLSQAVANAGHGDYIEIGSLHGGSAITAALVKKVFNLTGFVFCIDPAPKGILENAKLFGVEEDIRVFRGTSEEYFEKVSSPFKCAFIDGDHRDPYPLEDFMKLSKVVVRYIIFDDYDKSEPGVETAVRYAMDYEGLWNPVHISNAIAIFEKINK